jgi:NADPH:quinone reductase-like Zn-dependent oxidoreductase
VRHHPHRAGLATQPPAGGDDAAEIAAVRFVQESDRRQLIELARLVDEGHLRPQVGATYPLAEAVEAFTAKAAGGVPGRIVLEP